MFQEPFVVLDLETSGIDPKKDDIIEVAMIRYENGKEVRRYDDLIRLDYELPKIITVITGITDKDLRENGKDRQAAFKEIEEVLRGAYMVGHNIPFDAGFLREKGVKMEVAGLIDTVPLAQIFFPEAASYSLETLSDDLGITHVNKHRAMGDVEATLELFKKMNERIGELPAETIAEIKQHIARSEWGGGSIFRTAKPLSTSNMVPSGQPEKTDISLNEKGGVRRALGVEEVLSEGGLLQQFWTDYEPRPQQETMAKNVINAFEQAYHLICEAPTGVGKSLGYLIPAAETAIKNKSKVVVSTNTINLQEQLYEKDIPLLKEIYRFGTGNTGVRAALLKGRSHYLCLRRLAKFKERERFSDDEIILLTKILVWQNTGENGDIHLSRNENLIWDFELCSDKKYCSPQKCRPYGECYLHRAHKQAEEADIIIVNHALLCADLVSEGSLLPDYQYLVIDEAHQFEEATTDAFGMSLKEESLTLPIKIIQSYLEKIKKQEGGQMAMERAERALERLPEVRQAIENLFTVIGLFINRNVEESGYVEHLLVDQLVMADEQWLNLGVSADEAMRALKGWLNCVRELIDAMALSADEVTDQDERIMDILQEHEVLEAQTTTLSHFFADESKDFIRWMTLDLGGAITMNLAPCLPGDHLKETLYSQKKSIVLTSATLGVKLADRYSDTSEQHPFTYLRTMLSLDERFEELIIDSPFDFEKQVFVMVPKNALPITSPKSVQQLTPFFEELIRKVGGNMLSLFTSYRMIETLYLGLMEPLQNEGVRLLAQRISGGRNKIMKAYMNDPAHSVLFGTASFWEGVDIKGEALTTLVIHKLPFDVPSDPVCKARGQMFRNGFYEYSLPRAILKFRQGFGRLIRSKKDYGVMVVLDNRVLEKDYGKLFLDALPDNITLETIPLMDIPDQTKQWLDLNRNIIS